MKHNATISSSDAERVQQIAKQLPSLAPEAIGATPDPINPPLSKKDLETLEALRSDKAKLVTCQGCDTTLEKDHAIVEGLPVCPTCKQYDEQESETKD